MDTHTWVATNDDTTYSDLNIDGSQHSEAGKASNRTNVTVINSTFKGGKEDCFDMVRGSNYVFQDCVFYEPQTQNITAKAAIKGLTFDGCSFDGKPKNAHIELGQYSDYEMCNIDKTKDILIKDCTSDQGKIIVKVWKSESPTVINSNVKIIKIHWIIREGYFWFRRIQDFFRYGRNGKNNACNR